MKLKIATYNIAAGLNGDYFKKKNYYISADIIKHINADIIGLNEVGKPLPKEIEDHTRFIARHCGYENYIFGEAAIYRSYPYGNAILSRYPIDKSEVFPIKRHRQLLPGIYEPRCVLTANILCEKPIRIICTFDIAIFVFCYNSCYTSLCCFIPLTICEAVIFFFAK